MPETTEERLKAYIDRQLTSQNKLILGVGDKVDELKDTMNGKIQALELKNAYREGIEKAAGAVAGVPDGDDWKKATFKLIGIIAAIVTLATTAATLVAKALL